MIKLKSLLKEASYYDPEEFENLPSIKIFEIKPNEPNELLKNMVAAAQSQYDSWKQDNDGMDVELGSGGICHLIAEDLASILNNVGIECYTVTSNYDQHVYLICKFKEGVYSIDIPYSIYETGGGFKWKKLPDVVFNINHITIVKLDNNPNNITKYIDEI